MSTLFSFRSRKDGCYWLTLFGLNFSGQLVWRRHAPGFTFRWGSGDGAEIGFMVSLLATFWFHWDVPWRVSRRVPFLRGEERHLGAEWFNGTIRVMFGYQPMGTHWGHRKERFHALRNAWRNKELHIWRNTWVTGRDRYCKRTLDTREVVIDCGRWPGDQYRAIQKHESARWTNRFRTKRAKSYWWDVQEKNGIPTEPHGKWGDRYGETFGFGATDDGSPVEAILARRLVSLLRNWPEGLVATYPAEEARP